MDTAKDRVGYMLVTAMGIAAFWVAGDFRPESAVFPRFVAGLMTALGLLLLARSFRTPAPAPAGPLAGDETEPELEDAGLFIHRRRFVTVVVLSLVYCIFVHQVGYFTASAVMIPLMAFMIGLRSPLTIAVSTAVYVVTFYLTFSMLFNRPLMPELIFQLLP